MAPSSSSPLFLRMLFLSPVLLGACSASVTSFTPCAENVDCRQAFGFGWGCALNTGFCEEITPHARCTETYPAQLFEEKDRFSEYIVFGSLFEHTDGQAYVDAISYVANQVDQGDRQPGDEAPLPRIGFVHCQLEEDTQFDSLSRVEAAEETAGWLVENLAVPAIVGPDTSSAMLRAFESTLDASDTFIISPSATAEKLTEVDAERPGQIWRTCSGDNLQARRIAERVKEMDVHNVAVITLRGDTYAEGVRDAFLANYEEEGVNEVSYGASFDSTDLFQVLADMNLSEHEDVELVLFVSPSVDDNVRFVVEAANPASANFFEKHLFLADGAASAQFVEKTGDDFQYLLGRLTGTRPGITNRDTTTNVSLLDFYVGAQVSEENKENAYLVYTHDASWLAMYSAAWSFYQHGEITGRGMSEGMQMVSSGPEQTSLGARQWPESLRSFVNGESIDVQGASGPLDYDPLSEETEVEIEFWTVVATGNPDNPYGFSILE